MERISTATTDAPAVAISTASGTLMPRPVGANYRWRICALLFFATTINYMDRQVLGILAPVLGRTIGWNELQYGYITAAFQTAYALGLLVVGSFIDRVGTRVGYAVAICLWSLSALGASFARSAISFGVARFMLGLGESGNFPAAIKAIAEWFPKRERALATGVFNSGTNVGAIVAPLTVPWIALHLGWPWAFRFTGAFSAIWLIAWLLVYRRPREKQKLVPAELAYIESDPAEPVGRVPWARLLPHRQTWAFVLGKFMTDPIWWFYLFWLAKFFSSEHGLSLTKLSLPLVTVYVMADVGSVGGGWISLRFLKRGWSVNRARKTAMLICALAVVPVIFVPFISSLWPVVALIGLATAGHQGWSANIFTLSSDMFPRRAVGSIVGLGGFGGASGGILFSLFTGFLLQRTHSYLPLFIIAGSAYLLALMVVQLLAPRLERAEIRTAQQS